MKKSITILSWVIFPALFLSTTHAQIVGTNAYIQGGYLELGINQNGCLVADEHAPDGYHDSGDFMYFGMVIDQDMDGWDTGTPAWCGDYFAPGSPEEGFAIQIDGDVYVNAPFVTDMPGSITSYTTTVGGKIVEWQGDLADPGLHITQTITTRNNKRYFQVQVKIQNTSDAPLTNVYYSRNTDPDNETQETLNFITENVVLYNHPADEWAMATAEGTTYGCMLALGSMQLNSRASYGGFSTSALKPKNAFQGVAPYSITGSATGDLAISLTFKIGTINPGQTKVLNFVYGADADELVEALRLTTDEIAANEELLINGENAFNPVVTISPNPSNGLLHFMANGIDPSIEFAEIEIYNSLGQIVYSETAEVSQSSLTLSMNLDGQLPNGTYFIRIVTNDVSTTEPFVLNR